MIEQIELNLRAPFPWFGGKSRVASLVWERFGDTPNYIEPFFGSGAVLLGRPTVPGTETVNDLDCYLANFWRALTGDPAGVARAADWPVNEADLHARHVWLTEQGAFRERLKSDPFYYDQRIAGWWVWGQSAWIGDGWCHLNNEARPRLPHLGSRVGRGMHRSMPSFGDFGRGVHRRSLPTLSHDVGVHSERARALRRYFGALARRMRRVRVACGQWDRILGDAVTVHNGATAVFLDPPYPAAEHDMQYASDPGADCAGEVARWAIENGGRPGFKIALCGYEGAFAMPPDWECVPWKAVGGYGLQGAGRGRENRHRERIWFSPGCDPSRQQKLF